MAGAESYELLYRKIAFFSNILNEELTIKGCNNLFTPISFHAFLSILMKDPWFGNNPPLPQFLEPQDSSRVISLYKNVLATLNSANNTVIYNNCFVNTSNKLQDNFKKSITENFGSTINFLNFTSPEARVDTINSWFANRTNDKLKCFNSIKDDTYLTFLSATRFENNWCDQFETEHTERTLFHLTDDRTIEVEMMKKTGEFYYKKLEDGSKILKLPFVDSSVSLVVILPDKSMKLEQLDGFFGFQSFTGYLKGMIHKEEVDVSLPKFRISTSVDMTRYLKTMRLEGIFDAYYLGIIQDEELSFNTIEQNVFLNVHEKGVEAATGTISILTKGSDEKVTPKDGLIIYEANISAEISNRFAKTLVVWRVKNSNQTAAEAQFKVVLTETAFITGFTMEIDGKMYKSHIQEKEVAKNIFMEAVFRGQSAGLVEAKTRDSQEFSVSVNLESESVAVFSLTYEEMLQRLHDQYELVLNINPGQIVDDLTVEVRINESRPLKFVKTPPLRSGKDISDVILDKRLDPEADIKMITGKTSTVKFRPNASMQRKFARNLKTDANEGLMGQFVVQYDVEREPQNGEVLLQDGYFIHFFASNDLDPLPKHIVFVLDTSGSMAGRKIEQLKDAMMNILDDLRKDDMLSIIEFNNEVIVWDTNSKKCSPLSVERIGDFKNPFNYLQKYILADPQQVNSDIIKKSKEVVRGLVANGSTFMIGGLETALYLVKTGQTLNENRSEKLQPIIVFLTDGEPNVGIRSTHDIVELVTQLNTESKTPIFSLSFGNGADKNFLRKLSLKNLGFSRHIYEAADASLQLQEFYKQISAPVLHDIKFKYDAEVEQVTKTWFPIYFRGAELVVAGRYRGGIFPTIINCCGPYGPIAISSTTETPASSLERLWAYLTVKQLLEERESAANPHEVIKRATDLALKYSFVTDVTSLVVVKPNDKITHVDSQSTNFGPNSDDEVRYMRQSKMRKCASYSAASLATKVDSALGPNSFMFGCPSQQSTLQGTTSFATAVQNRNLFGGIPPPPPPTAAHVQSQALCGFSSASSQVFGVQRGTSFGTAGQSGNVFGGPPPPAASHVHRSPLFGTAGQTTSAFGDLPKVFGVQSQTGSLFGYPSGAPTSQALSTTPVGQTRSTVPTQGLVDYSIDFSSTMEVDTEEQDAALKKEKQRVEFTADRPFFIALVSEKDKNFLVLLRGKIYDPNKGM